jgi:hypothetical protein
MTENSSNTVEVTVRLEIMKQKNPVSIWHRGLNQTLEKNLKYPVFIWHRGTSPTFENN